ncbi:hypothetical protein D3C80_2059030 [compost metagenome]
MTIQINNATITNIHTKHIGFRENYKRGEKYDEEKFDFAVGITCIYVGAGCMR